MSATATDPWADLGRKLAAPFDPDDVKWLPKSVKGNQALAIPYLDARAVQDRLDEVLGPANWRDEYSVLPDGSVTCRLSLRASPADDWIGKEDVGSPSEQPDGGDRLKAAFSDALKRVAVKWGVGRFLYRIKPQWAPYDPQRKQITQPPRIPEFIRDSRPAGGPPDNMAARRQIEQDYGAAKTQADLDQIKALVRDADARCLLSDADKKAACGYAAAASARVKSAAKAQPAPPPTDDTDDISY